MKSFMYGMAMILLCSIFLVFQTDINQMQRESMFIYETANEIANAAALQLVYNSDDDSDIYTYSNGYIEYVTADAFEKGYQVAHKTLSLDSSYNSAKNYYSDTFEVTIYLFNESGKVYKSTNESVPTLLPKVFVRGMRATEFISEMDPDDTMTINYPCTICVVDAGKPRIRLTDLTTDDVKIRKLGIYEYKDAEQ